MRASLIDEAEQNQPCFQRKGLVGENEIHALLGENFSHLSLQRLAVKTRGMPIEGHQNFVGKMTVYTVLETTFENLCVFVVLRAKKRVHMRLDKIAKHHVEGGWMNRGNVGRQQSCLFDHVERRISGW